MSHVLSSRCARISLFKNLILSLSLAHDRSIEGYIAEKLEHFRCAMARAIIEDLLSNAFKVVEEAADAVSETHRSEVASTTTMEEEGKARLRASSAVPIAIKSFSFV